MIEHIKYTKTEERPTKKIRYVKFTMLQYRIIVYSILFIGIAIGKYLK
jgi:hypothetical protein